MKFNTPLRYPGGKGKLTEFIKLLLVQNELISGHYIEPYTGGGGVALNLLMDEYASHIHLNDLNRSIHAFWWAVLNQPDELCEMIHNVSVTMAEWFKQKEIQIRPEEHSQLELGFSTFFLNRTNRSGILWGGVIGGKNQDGRWKIDARFKKEDLINRIGKIALAKARISLYNLDAKDLIKTILPTLPKKSLVYLDPPYYVKGKGLYENHYAHDDHVEIAKLVKTEIRLPWLVSYDHAPEIMGMYDGCSAITYGINYSAQDRYKGAEAMFFSPDIIVPDVENPVNLKAA